MTYPQNHALSTVRILDLARRAKVRNDPQFHKIAVATELTKSNALMKAVEKSLGLKAICEDVLQIPFDFPSQDTLDLQNSPELKVFIGMIQRLNQPFFRPLNLLASHLLLLGSSGSGKTTLFYGIVAQCLTMNIPVIIVDYMKQDYRHLKKQYPQLAILKAGKDFIFNSLQVPNGVHPQDWRSAWVVVFCKANGLLDGSESLLLKAVTQLYEQLGVFDGSKHFPTLIDLHNKIMSYNLRGNYREAGFQQSISNRLYAYISLLGETAEYNSGLPIERIGATPLVLEFKGLSERIARFMVSILLYALFMHRIATGQRGSILRNLVLIDEAHSFAPAGMSNDKFGDSPMESILKQSREAGIGLALGSQSAALDRGIMINSATKIAMHLGDGEDMEQVRKSFALTPEQAAYIPKMDVGEAIIRVKKEDPFLISTLRTKFG